MNVKALLSLASEHLVFSLSLELRPEAYHTFDYLSYDYPFYYYNLRANAANRVEQFLSNRGFGREISSEVKTVEARVKSFYLQGGNHEGIEKGDECCL